ncbi:hypothetical protein [Rhodococcus sp. BUPNP1]|uniref:hypothetical protein n=1 Tax=Rhodococcus sp. BUPNP1 TaxID=1432786 RepID=UPI000B5AB993|nr:hypothetical protein [Rhodococcus sp. BUPNP1]OWY82295.1 hypothetical protein B9C99_08215 [Rhodococcus sp. BUPNP1]
MYDDLPVPPAPPVLRNGAGNAALIAGIVALVFAFVPVIGDFVAIPVGLVAVVCGWIGLERADKGTATNHREALSGACLGAAALFAVFVVFAAVHSSAG